MRAWVAYGPTMNFIYCGLFDISLGGVYDSPAFNVCFVELITLFIQVYKCDGEQGRYGWGERLWWLIGKILSKLMMCFIIHSLG